MTHFFTSLGLPFPHAAAVFVSILELGGGILLILGLGSRLMSALLFIDMLVAYITADRAALVSFASDPGKFYTADEYTFLFAAAIVFVFGPWRFAVDTLLKERLRTPIELLCRSIESEPLSGIVLNNPHNPSGAMLERQEILRVVETANSRGLILLLDEAFVDYAPYASLVREAAAQEGVIVVRSLTKFYGCPALRVATPSLIPMSFGLSRASCRHGQSPSWR